MALVKATLTQSLTNWLNVNTYPTVYDSVKVFCDAYEAYALTAMDVSGDTPLLTNKSNMLGSQKTIWAVADQAAMLALSNATIGHVASRLDNNSCYTLTGLPASNLSNWSSVSNPVLNMLSGGETSASAASKFANAVYEFWNGATFKLTIPPPGTVLPEISAIVTTNIVKSTLASALVSIFSNNSGTAASKASQIADALHTATLTVTVTCIGTVNPGAVPTPVIGPIS